jgi:hypothetical protein
MLSQKEGKNLISLARKSILSAFNGKDIPDFEIKKDGLNEKKGVFVTLTLNDELRGCIGYPYPTIPLYKAVMESAKAAAFDDIRFHPMTEDEISDIRIEISVLTKPEEIRAQGEGIIKDIEVGKDGLIIEYSGFSGLLLPQVASENKWDAEKFLEQTCIKAGVSPKSWKNKSCKIYKFQAQIFTE